MSSRCHVQRKITGSALISSKWLDWLESRPFTTLFVDGNHENFPLLYSFPEGEWHGGRVHRVREHVLHLTRGQIFEIGGLTFFTMGGAQSHDVQDGILDPEDPDFKKQYRMLRQRQARFRVKGKSWWPEELPSDAEYQEALTNLDKAGWEVDCVLTHCGPSHIAEKLGHSDPDRLTEFLEEVSRRCRFEWWFFGHYHDNRIIDDKYVLQWERISQLEF